MGDHMRNPVDEPGVEYITAYIHILDLEKLRRRHSAPVYHYHFCTHNPANPSPYMCRVEIRVSHGEGSDER